MFAPGILGSFGTTVQMPKENQTLKKANPKFSVLLLKTKILWNNGYLFQAIFVCHPSLSHAIIKRYFR